MIRINLLPYREEGEKWKVLQHIIIFLCFLLLAFSGLVAYHFHLSGQIKSLNAKIEKTQREVVKYEKIVAKVEEVRKKIDELKKKMGVIDQLKTDSEEAFLLLDTLTNSLIGNRMWLTYFEAIEKRTRTKKKIKVDVIGKDGKKKKKKKNKTITVVNVNVNIKIEGVALDNKTVADFMTNIEDAKAPDGKNLFANTKLVYVKEEEISQGKGRPAVKLKGFQVACQRAKPKKADNDKKKKPRKK
ncbi:PilN domain-containing protein [Desulfococcaceae bacterium HSG8]|nr:PilN domain-containing protein [Desulfococcaceae bacterium HSG8]